MDGKIISAIVLLASLFFSAPAANSSGGGADSHWRMVGRSPQANISGMALIEQTGEFASFLVVHDNKKKKQPRAAVITLGGDAAPQFVALEWPAADVPVDLEAVTRVPGAANDFLALTSAGRIYHIRLDRARNSVDVIKSFDAPAIPEGGNFEGFSLQRVGETQLAVWAERGEDARPATLFWSKFDLQNYAFSPVASASVKVSYPNSNVRHISDVKVDEAGRVFISSAADPGDDGPFASAVYLAGKFSFPPASDFKFEPAASPSPLFSVGDRKIEAFELLPEAVGGMVFGTDDENLGSAIYYGRRGPASSFASLHF